ncbi:MAG: T9SS type A sorting domain-containing protein [Chitinophagaceae bacterium]
MKNLFRSGLIMWCLISTLTINAQVPVISSNPSASAVVFLDFDGQCVTGTSWNFNGPIYCGPSGLNTAQITETFNRVAEDYRPFNINVTTDSTKYLNAPIAKRMRVIVTISSEWYGNSGGVAFIGSFIWGDDTPCFVFSALLGYNVKNISEAASHEAGHTLGLYHQSTYDANCVKISEYNYGLGSGEIGWAPIMGAGYYQNLTLWNNGPNPYGCNSLQSDLTIITTNNGFSYRTDDYSSAFNQATNAPFVNNQFTVSGIVERNTDQDMIKFTQPATGRFILTAVPYNVGTGNSGSDLDLQITLFNSSQSQLNVFNPGSLLNSVIDTTLNPGTYYLRIEGKGNVYAPNYASLGSYSLQGNWSASTLPLHRLELHGQLNGDRHQLSWIIDADEQVTEQILEISTDGRNFSPVIQTGVNDRGYDYRPNISGVALYRLSVTFDNGRQYYSNVVTLRKTSANAGPKLVSNLVASNSFEVSSPGVYNYAVYDLSGKTLAQGKLVNGSNIITPSNMTSGMYVVRFTNGTGQWMEKLVKQ